MTTGPYARVYHSIVDDPKFARVFGDDRALASWLRLLLLADAMYPTSAPMPAKTKAVQLLLEVGLLVEQPGGRYIVKGLASEREMRSQSARNAAAMRWQSGGNASKAEQSITKTSNGASAPGAPAATKPVFLGFPPKKPEKLTAEQVESYRRHAASRDPLVAANARETLERHGIPVEVEA